MADFDAMKNAMYNAIHPTGKIPLSDEVIYKLTSEWGNEVILKCKCNSWRSHSMYGQKGYGRCGACNTNCIPVFESWSTPVAEDNN